MFSQLLSNLKRFLSKNSYSIRVLLTKINEASKHKLKQPASEDKKVGIPIFAIFLKQKVIKDMNMQKIQEVATKIDIDQDGYINECDLVTCIGNLGNQTFIKRLFDELDVPTKPTMNEDKLLEVAR